jgi:hypothetical protein
MITKAMTVGDILDSTFTLYRKNFRKYWALAALGVVPTAIVSLLHIMFVLPLDNFLDDFFFYNTTTLMGWLVTGLFAFFLSTVMYAALIATVSDELHDRNTEIREAFLLGIRKFIPLFAGGVLVMLAVTVGLVLLVAPGVYVGVLFAMYVHVIVIEGENPWSALKRSRALIGGFWWRSLGMFILIGVLAAVISAILSAPVGIVTGIFFFADPYRQQIIQTILNVPVSILVTPLTAIAYTLYYYDLRIRQEHLDLDIMIDRMVENKQEDPLL